MKIAVLGTGMVGRALAARLHTLGHDVVIGTRDPAQTLARLSDEPDALRDWQAQTAGIPLLSYSVAGTHGELLLNATAGIHSLDALELVGEQVMAGKVLLDLAIPLDLSAGYPPSLTIANDDSLGERIQRRFPATHVVKSLHTMYFQVMIDPGRLPGRHVVFVGGNSESAKGVVTGILHEFGWPSESVVDLGGIQSARATEMYSRLFFDLYGRLGTFDFNIGVVTS